MASRGVEATPPPRSPAANTSSSTLRTLRAPTMFTRLVVHGPGCGTVLDKIQARSPVLAVTGRRDISAVARSSCGRIGSTVANSLLLPRNHLVAAVQQVEEHLLEQHLQVQHLQEQHLQEEHLQEQDL